MSFVEETEAFKYVTVPDTGAVQKYVENMLDGFMMVAKLEIHEATKPVIEEILKKGREFHELTHRSVVGSNKIAGYCSNIISHIEELIEEKARGEDFHEALLELLSIANECRNEAIDLKDGYTRICNDLKDISEGLEEGIEYVKNEEAEQERNVHINNYEKKKAIRKKWKYTAGTIGATVLAPATVGISLLLARFFEDLANEKEKEVNKCREDEHEARYIVKELNKIGCSAKSIVTQTVNIVHVLELFQGFWDMQVIEIENRIEEFENKKNSNVGYNKLTGKAVIRKWSEVQERYKSYSHCVLLLLNHTSLDRRNRRLITDGKNW